MATTYDKVAIIGAGIIGLSFAALHLAKNPRSSVMIFDTRPDLQDYVTRHLPGYLVDADSENCMKRLSFATTLEAGVSEASIVQEQGPETVSFKKITWQKIEEHAPKTASLWSSTSGIPASQQNVDMKDRSRLVVVHPFNPPHIMPLLEVVPSAETSDDAVNGALEYWRKLGRVPILVHKECTGFVANRLAFAMFREACSLVTRGIVSVQELDEIVQASMGPRWAVAGPFKSYHAGGGEGGLTAFMDKLGGTLQNCWTATNEDISKGDINVGSGWQASICRQAEEAYGNVDTADRDEKTRKVLQVTAAK